MATQEISDFTNLNGENIGTFVNVLRGGSALAAVTRAAGGQSVTADFRDHRLPIVTRTTLPKKYAEGATRTSSDAATTTAPLNIAIYDDWSPVSVEFERTTDPANVVATVVDASAALFPRVFDIEYLGGIVGGASVTSQEWDASDPIGSIDSLMANYDETAYPASGVVLTRAGARKLRFAQDADNRLQNSASGGIGGLFDLPSALTVATGTELGVATVMAIVGPFHAGAWGTNGSMTSERMPQATVDGQGPGTGMVQYLNRAAMGYANGIDAAANGTGFTILIDAV